MKDWNEAGFSAKEAGDNARRWTPSDGKDAPKEKRSETFQNGQSQEGDDSGFRLICLADVNPERVTWLWEPYLALGKLAVLGGDPDMGKSQITNDIAARLSKEGVHWPLGPLAPMGSSIFICSEDGLADTVRPRCEAAGADLTMIHVFKSTFKKSGKRKVFNLQDDLETLGNAIQSLGNSCFVTIDAITSYMGKIDSHRTTEVRGVLEPVADFAEANKVCILGVTHPPKNAQGGALRSFTGSFAFVAAPRLAHFAMREPDTDRNLFLPVKNNIGPKGRGVGYRIAVKDISCDIRAPYIQWDDAPVDYTADQAIAANSADMRDPGAMDRAKEFLRELLADGPVEAIAGEKAAEKRGIKERTLNRAKQQLRIKAVKEGFGPEGRWVWKFQ